MNALMLCAGLGTRFLPVTEKIAKPALPFMNVPLMGYSLYYLEQSGLRNLTLNTHHLPESVGSTIKSLTREKSYKVNLSHEPLLLGSGGGIRHARHYLTTGSDFIVANGDEVILFNHEQGFGPLLEHHRQSHALATLLTTDHIEAGKSMGGVWSFPDGNIFKLGGQGEEPDAQHFTGVFVFSPRIFSFMPESRPFHIFEDCLHKAMAEGEDVHAFHDPHLLWLDMASEREYVKATQRVFEEMQKDSPYAHHLAKIHERYGQSYERVGEKQWFGPGAKFEGLLDTDSCLLLGSGSEIGPGVEVNGFAVLGSNSRFTQGYIESSAIAADIQIHELVALRKQLVATY